ncbi:MAG: ABC transporter permease subunit [Gaiellaceae bacterium MAG52_C11]|nr:ABC transporter permease subunit [Candidatus Gaiellasilicea maunaloa]
MSSTGSSTVAAAPPVAEVPPPPSRRRGYAISLAFLAPAVFFLGVWVIYPAIRTLVRSFFSDRGGEFVWFDNYTALFTDEAVQTAIKNNVIWVLVVPAGVTALGLLFAVLTERVPWAAAFKVAVFVPLAVSLFAVGVIWRIMYQQDPDRGAINAGIVAVQGIFSEQGALTTARPSTDALTGSPQGGLRLERAVGPGAVALLGLTAIKADELPDEPEQAVTPQAIPDGITGVVWRDFKPGGGTPGEVETDEVGLGGVTVKLRSAETGKTMGSTTTGKDGSFTFEGVESGSYHVAIGKETFAEPFQGFNWLGDTLITPSLLIAFLWVQAGFAMVITAAGLAAIPRDLQEAARTDGGTEWQVFRRITVPLLAPVLTVVFVTQIIGVLKVFDIVISIVPSSGRDSATVIAVEMYQSSFSGQNRFGFGSAISIFMFLLFVPFLIANIRRFRREN